MKVFEKFLQKLTRTGKPKNSAEPSIEFKATAVLAYVKGLWEQLRCCLQQQGVRAVSSRRQRKFIDRDPCYYTRRVKEAIHLRLHPSNINRDSGIEIPEAWMPMIKKHNNRRAVRQRTAEEANHWVISKDRNAPIRAVENNWSLQSIMLYKITHDQSTSSPEED